jgi:hypothetical protein
VQVAALPFGADIEIECVATLIRAVALQSYSGVLVISLQNQKKQLSDSKLKYDGQQTGC